jgi:hypothetical protein
MQIATLRERLADWTDWDIAGFQLARSLSLIAEDANFQTDTKHIFWSNNPTGDMLHRMLQQLVVIGALEKRDEPDDQYRWNPNFQSR